MRRDRKERIRACETPQYQINESSFDHFRFDVFRRTERFLLRFSGMRALVNRRKATDFPRRRCNEVFTGNQPCQCGSSFQHFGNCLSPSLGIDHLKRLHYKTEWRKKEVAVSALTSQKTTNFSLLTKWLHHIAECFLRSSSLRRLIYFPPFTELVVSLTWARWILYTLAYYFFKILFVIFCLCLANPTHWS